MPAATLTSKGQITVPKPVRDALGVRTGDRLGFRIQENGTVLIEPQTVDLMSLQGVLKPTVRGVTVEDMNRDIRKAAARQ